MTRRSLAPAHPRCSPSPRWRADPALRLRAAGRRRRHRRRHDGRDRPPHLGHAGRGPGDRAQGRQPRREAFGDRGHVSVTSYNRLVLLTGEVPTEADKATVEQVVAAHRQRALGRQRAARRPPSSFDETLATTRCSRARSRPAWSTRRTCSRNSFKVVTERGIVYLMGRVTEREANRATEIARGVSGVQKVVHVFEIVTEAELASRAARAPAKPASAPRRARPDPPRTAGAAASAAA